MTLHPHTSFFTALLPYLPAKRELLPRAHKEAVARSNRRPSSEDSETIAQAYSRTWA